ncbi:unnamed protein product [Coregonus sp. 'balchen']|nr:unnamed protein product [Coregonus sp. 'balchen']
MHMRSKSGANSLPSGGVSEGGQLSDLAGPADAHVQGLCVATCPIQHLGGQLHHQPRALGLAFQRTGIVRVVIQGQPLVVPTLVAYVGMCRALLGTEVTGVWGAFLRESVPKQCDLLVLSIKLSNSSLLTIAGCYRSPSAPACTINALSSLLAPYTKSEFDLRACVRNGCSVKRPVLICHRRLLQNLNEQSFLHDLASVNWYRISLIPSVEDSWTFFFHIFSGIVNKHAPIKKMIIKNRFSPWFDRQIYFSLQAVTESEVLKELLKLDPQETSGIENRNIHQVIQEHPTNSILQGSGRPLLGGIPEEYRPVGCGELTRLQHFHQARVASSYWGGR